MLPAPDMAYGSVALVPINVGVLIILVFGTVFKKVLAFHYEQAFMTGRVLLTEGDAIKSCFYANMHSKSCDSPRLLYAYSSRIVD
jgi:hypothetical protein